MCFAMDTTKGLCHSSYMYTGPSEDGDNFHHELRGVIPRTFEYLFNLVNREREKVSLRWASGKNKWYMYHHVLCSFVLFCDFFFFA